MWPMDGSGATPMTAKKGRLSGTTTPWQHQQGADIPNRSTKSPDRKREQRKRSFRTSARGFDGQQAHRRRAAAALVSAGGAQVSRNSFSSMWRASRCDGEQFAGDGHERARVALGMIGEGCDQLRCHQPIGAGPLQAVHQQFLQFVQRRAHAHAAVEVLDIDDGFGGGGRLSLLMASAVMFLGAPKPSQKIAS
jgi:hypothetical protein